MSTEGFIHQSEINNTNLWMNLEEVANILSISTATVKNWVKTQKMSAELRGGLLLFNRDQVLKLKHEIESGISHRLKSRRNKKTVKGNAIPVEYVDSVEYIQATEGILRILARENLQIEPRLILLEVALDLLFNKRVIHIKSIEKKVNNPEKHTVTGELNNPEQTLQAQDIERPSLTELAMQDKLSLGSLEEILLELWDFKGIHSFGNAHCSMPIESVEQPRCFQAKLPLANREVLRAVRQLEIRWIRGEDLLGLVYMALSNFGKRKRKGSYYTPTFLVNPLVQKSLNLIEGSQAPKIIDPCCGTGNFLIKSYLALEDRAKREGRTRTREEAEKEVLSSSLHGYDIDSVAVSLAKINLLLLLEASWRKSLNLIASEIISSLNQNIQCKNALESCGSFFVSSDVETYDLVIGNPPWGYSFTNEEAEMYRKSFLAADTSPESFSLFIEYGLSLLSVGGLLAFVLPEALLNVKTHCTIRKLLLERSKLINIQLLGHKFSRVFTPTITLLTCRVNTQKEKQQGESLDPFINDDSHQIHVELGNENYSIPQKRFYENEMYIFNVKASNEEDEILDHMRTLPGALSLVGQADFALGIVTGNNKEFVLQERVEGAEPILKGNDIFKYNAYPSGNFLVFDSEKFQQVAPVVLYRAKEKLLYRFINESLVFAYDDCQNLTLNSGNMVIPRLRGYSMKYVLAVLNSRAAQFFHTATFSSVKVLRKHIESIPIPPCEPATQECILNLVEKLIKSDEPRRRILLYEEIDMQLMSLYALTSEQQERIRARFPVTKHLSKD